jgi:hypothetical protein
MKRPVKIIKNGSYSYGKEHIRVVNRDGINPNATYEKGLRLVCIKNQPNEKI